MEPLIILFLSVVQSIFGVGLLLFGTPILLLLDYSYNEALLYLLPASLAISAGQVVDTLHLKLDGSYRKKFFLCCLPFLVLGMIVSTKMNLKAEMNALVLVMLLVAFLLRTNDYFKKKIQFEMKANLSKALGIMGLIHGLSNMGGAILTPLVSTLYKDKNRVLAGISFDYAIMAFIQLVIVIVFSSTPLEFKYLAGPFIAYFTRKAFGKRIFAFTSDGAYQNLLNGFILASAVLVCFKL